MKLFGAEGNISSPSPQSAFCSGERVGARGRGFRNTGTSGTALALPPHPLPSPPNNEAVWGRGEQFALGGTAPFQQFRTENDTALEPHFFLGPIIMVICRPSRRG